MYCTAATEDATSSHTGGTSSHAVGRVGLRTQSNINGTRRKQQMPGISTNDIGHGPQRPRAIGLPTLPNRPCVCRLRRCAQGGLCEPPHAAPIPSRAFYPPVPSATAVPPIAADVAAAGHSAPAAPGAASASPAPAEASAVAAPSTAAAIATPAVPLSPAPNPSAPRCCCRRPLRRRHRHGTVPAVLPALFPAR